MFTKGWAAVGSLLGGWAPDRLQRNIGWYGLAELAVRLSRLVTTIILARVLFPADYGIAAAALTCFELVRMLANNGVGLMIVRAVPADLDRACITAWRVSLGVTAAMVSLQLVAGGLLAARMERLDIFLMLAFLAASYLALPLTEVRWCRMLRDQRMKTLAGITAAQVLLDNGLTAVLALAGAGPWAVVAPKLLTTPLYVWLIWRAEPWRRPRSVSALPWPDVRRFALPVVGTEALAALRQHADKILVGAMLGIEALGAYAFAFNAGLGLSLALTAALSVSLYPHLAEAAGDRREMLDRFDRALLATAAPIALVLAVQAAVAAIYVPIIFGARWAFAAPLVALLCLSAVARPFADAACQLLRARGETMLELVAQVGVTAVVLTSLAVTLPYGLERAALVFACATVTCHILLVILVRRHAGRRPSAVIGATA